MMILKIKNNQYLLDDFSFFVNNITLWNEILMKLIPFFLIYIYNLEEKIRMPIETNTMSQFIVFYTIYNLL
jgi:hypothetical protein